ncbi:MAG: D-aminoacyl-tRNA deacylase [Nanobdellota archaeon]
MYSVIISEKDLAGMNIFEHLKGFPKENFELIKINKDTLDADNIKTKGEIVIFATRHVSKEKRPCFCVHTPGNWSTAKMGGKDNELCMSFASLQREFYLELVKNNTLDFDVTMEATHHGPLIDKPCLFVEIGSSEVEWKNQDSGKIIAHTINQVLKRKIPNKTAIVGIGGPHYCNNFNKLLERTEYAVGHVCPKYMLQDFNSEILKQAIDKTYEGSSLVVLDWKGLGNYKQNVLSIVEKLGINYKKIKDLK